MAIHILQRAEGTITVRVLTKPTVINGKLCPRGWVHVLEGVNGEEYAFPPEIGRSNYKPDQAFLDDLEKYNAEVEDDQKIT